MKAPDYDEEFYIGYLAKAPVRHARFTRGVVAGAIGAGVAAVAFAALALPYFGAGRFAFSEVREWRGALRTNAAPRLVTEADEFLLVGAGKHGVPVEICGLGDNEVLLEGALIERDGRRLLELEGNPAPDRAIPAEAAPVYLGEVTLTGELVDSKCYFGVMNPGEGRLHRACAVQCLRGGVPAVFVARDRAGGSAELLVTGPQGAAINAELLRWVGEPVRVAGSVWRQGKWLVLRLDPTAITRAE